MGCQCHLVAFCAAILCRDDDVTEFLLFPEAEHSRLNDTRPFLDASNVLTFLPLC